MKEGLLLKWTTSKSHQVLLPVLLIRPISLVDCAHAFKLHKHLPALLIGFGTSVEILLWTGL